VFGGYIAIGIVGPAVIGFLVVVYCSSLLPLHADIPLPGGEYYHFTTALVFDIGVYLAVVGVILTALNKLGLEDGGSTSPGSTAPETPREGDGEDDGKPPIEPALDSPTTGGAR